MSPVFNFHSSFVSDLRSVSGITQRKNLSILMRELVRYLQVMDYAMPDLRMLSSSSGE